ncbi:MAG: hypothetical protein RDU20_14570 [Desulfomonilaceae bacterium]|nr:hypothetical protein [Desulfomonilaceae bacterium]
MSTVKRVADPRVKSVPDLVRKEALAAGIALAVVCLVSALLDAPLQGPADVGGLAASDVKAPWILVGIQELLKFLPALTAGVLMPFTAVLIIGAIPFLPDIRGLRPIMFFGTTLTFVVLTVRGYLS